MLFACELEQQYLVAMKLNTDNGRARSRRDSRLTICSWKYYPKHCGNDERQNIRASQKTACKFKAFVRPFVFFVSSCRYDAKESVLPCPRGCFAGFCSCLGESDVLLCLVYGRITSLHAGKMA